MLIVLYSLESPAIFKAQASPSPWQSFPIGFSLSSRGSFASISLISFSSSTSTPSGMLGLLSVSLPHLRMFWGWWTQFSREARKEKPGSFHYSPAGSIYFLSSALTLNMVLGTIWQLKLILTIWHFKRWLSFPLKWGFVQIVFSRSPVKMYLIFLEELIWSGVTMGNSFQFPFKRSVATQ